MPPKEKKKRMQSAMQSADSFTRPKPPQTSSVQTFNVSATSAGIRVKHSTVYAKILPPEDPMHSDSYTGAFGNHEDQDLLPTIDFVEQADQPSHIDGVEILSGWLKDSQAEIIDDHTIEGDNEAVHIQTRIHAHPLDDWRPLRQIFMDELLRLDGRGEHIGAMQCPRCKSGLPELRCRTCLTTELLCIQCTLGAHKYLPCHRIQRWSDEQRMFLPCTLQSLGHRIQLGHSDGSKCPNPTPAKARDGVFILIDVSGVHQLNLDYCNCFDAPAQYVQLLRQRLWPATIHFPATAMSFAALDQLQMISYESKLSIHDWYDAVVRLTDNTGLAHIPDRKEEVRRMLREWGNIYMLKRAGRGHDPLGVENTMPGSCAVLCPACPHAGKNLPEGWESVPDKQRWVYAQYVGLDGNFRSKRKNVSSTERDPALSDGCAYFVPAQEYKEYLNRWQGETQPRSNCVSHDAVNSADTKDTKGFLVSGIGAVDDIRHGFKRPNATGDLQKGERYVNMDYLFNYSLSSTAAKLIYVSYDIACQYSINFFNRFKKKFPNTPFNDGLTQLRFLVPKFHLPAHIPLCQWVFSFNFARWVGRTEGEALERNWPELNRLASTTKEMGPGARSDTMDEHMGDANWRKLIQLGGDLLKRMKAAIPEVKAAREQLEAMEESMAKTHNHHLMEWRSEMEQWHENPTQDTPFRPRIETPTKGDIRLKLAEAEARLEKIGDAINCEVSPAAMISMGIELEVLQVRLQRDVEELGPHATSTQRANILEQSTSLHTRIRGWMKVQAVYMPSTILLHGQDTRSASSIADVQAMNIKLWLPSALPDELDCMQELRDHEWSLRVAHAFEALEDLRSTIQLRGFLEKYRHDWTLGVREGLRSADSLEQARARVTWLAKRYNASRLALERLASKVNPSVVLFEKWQWQFQPLTESDLATLPAETLSVGEGTRRLSWIWVVIGLGGMENQDEHLTEALRLNWCRTKARYDRWDEEVTLLKEEMRRVLQFMEWHSSWWRTQTERCHSASPELREGLEAYAAKQSRLRIALRDRFSYLWRFVDSWIQSNETPAARRWFTDVVRPKSAPQSIFTIM